MKMSGRTLWILLLSIVQVTCIFAQSTIPATGGSASGTGGSATYTVGQVAYSVIPIPAGSNGFIVQGVQQPYEISTVTAIEDTEYITLGYSVYPNPTGGMLTLLIKTFEDDDVRYQLYDINGKVILEDKVAGKETEISMGSYSAGIYFLRVIKDDTEVKVFKIIKR